MPYCSRCGVEVQEQAVSCPLCHSAIQKFDTDPAPGRTFPEDELAASRPTRMNRKEKLHLAAVLTGFGMLIPVLITVTVNLIISTRLTWSLYPLIILSGSLILVLTALFSSRHPGRLIWISFLTISATLTALYQICNLPFETVSLGIPITLFAALCSHMVVFISLRVVNKGANIAALILISTGLFCILTDLHLSYSLSGSIRIGWSLVVLAATQPVSLILLYLYYRKKKDSKLKKFFHL